jgi:hypothetical protein
MRATLVLFLFVVAWLVAGVRSADACPCSRQAPCEAYWEADVVFVGTVTASSGGEIKTKTIKGKRVMVLDLRTNATLDVIETLRGSVDKTVSVETDDDGCFGVSWKTGAKYIVYAKRAGNRLLTRDCSRTSRLDTDPGADPEDDEDQFEAAAAAAIDLAYARSKPESAAHGFVQGVLMRSPADDTRQSAPVANAVVKVRGLPKAVTKSNAGGAFKILLPPGDHQLDIVAPGLRVAGAPPAVSIVARGACAIVEPQLIATGIARGRVVDHEGKPAAKVSVVARNTARKWHRAGVTNADGRFEIQDIPPAMQFVLSVAAPADGGPSTERPIPTRFYPAEPTEATAKTITLPASGVADGLDFAVAAPLRVIESSGTVKHRRYALGSAHVDATVGATTTRATVDKRGRFKVKHLPGTVTFEACKHRINVPSECKKVVRTLEAPGKVDIVLP